MYATWCGRSRLAWKLRAPWQVALAGSSLSEGVLLPAVLEALWQALQVRDGLAAEGVFRISAGESEVTSARRRLQEGDESEQVLEQASTACLAALIKLYLRELPRELWRPLRSEVEELPSDAQLAIVRLRELVTRLPRRSADLVIWVLDVMRSVVQRETENRMGPGAVTAVMAPVLMRGATEDNATDAVAAVAAAKRNVDLAGALLAAHAEARLTRHPAARNNS